MFGPTPPQGAPRSPSLPDRWCIPAFPQKLNSPAAGHSLASQAPATPIMIAARRGSVFEVFHGRGAVRMDVTAIASEKRDIERRFGKWTAHSIRLAEGLYTLEPTDRRFQNAAD